MKHQAGGRTTTQDRTVLFTDKCLSVIVSVFWDTIVVVLTSHLMPKCLSMLKKKVQTRRQKALKGGVETQPVILNGLVNGRHVNSA